MAGSSTMDHFPMKPWFMIYRWFSWGFSLIFIDFNDGRVGRQVVSRFPRSQHVPSAAAGSSDGSQAPAERIFWKTCSSDVQRLGQVAEGLLGTQNQHFGWGRSDDLNKLFFGLLHFFIVDCDRMRSRDGVAGKTLITSLEYHPFPGYCPRSLTGFLVLVPLVRWWASNGAWPLLITTVPDTSQKASLAIWSHPKIPLFIILFHVSES